MKITKYETIYNKKALFNKSFLKDISFPKRFENKVINIYPNIKFQKFLGFGAALTESAGYCFSKLSSEKQQFVIKDCFSKEGLNYSIVRLPIGSCDFSLNSYSYASKADLSDFSIERDKRYIIPFLKNAFKEKTLTLLSSPWSPPRFMKNTKMLNLGGNILNKYKQLWANYFVKYITAYKDEGFNIKYVTVQNEPNAIQTWESCLVSSEDEVDFVLNYLYPTFRKNNLETKILIWDHNKDNLFNRALEEFAIEGALSKIDGVAYHYYSGDHFENISLLRHFFSDKLLIHTEGCAGYTDLDSNKEFRNGEIYAHDIIGDLNSGSNAYIDWNLMLDSKGRT